MDELLKSILDAAPKGAIASKLGITEEETEKGLGALLPTLAGAAQKKVREEGGLGALVGLLEGMGVERHLDAPESASVDEVVGDGNDILGNLLGSKETSRAVADQAAKQSGLSAGLLKKLLPIAASLIMGFFAKKGKEGGGGLTDILGGILDKDGDGNFLDDILGGALGGLLGR